MTCSRLLSLLAGLTFALVAAVGGACLLYTWYQSQPDRNSLTTKLPIKHDGLMFITTIPGKQLIVTASTVTEGVGQARVCNERTFALVATMKMSEWITGIRASQDGRFLAVSAGALSVFDTANWQERHLDLRGITHFDFIADYGKLIVIDRKQQLVIHDCVTSAKKNIGTAGLRGAVSCLKSANAQNFVAIGYRDGRIEVWDYESACCIFDENVRTQKINSVLFCNGDKMLLSCDDAGWVDLWDVGGQRRIASRSSQPNGIASLNLTQTGRLLLVGTYGGLVRGWDADSLEERWTIRTAGWHSGVVALSPDTLRFYYCVPPSSVWQIQLNEEK
jgi:WD40 repeat protein